MRSRTKNGASAAGALSVAAAPGARAKSELAVLEAWVPSRPELGILRTTEPILLGRSTCCALSFVDPRVSRLHAEVYPNGDLWWIRDLDSLAGTYLDGQPIEAEPLACGAVVRLGELGPEIILELDRPSGCRGAKKE